MVKDLLYINEVLFPVSPPVDLWMVIFIFKTNLYFLFLHTNFFQGPADLFALSAVKSTIRIYQISGAL